MRRGNGLSGCAGGHKIATIGPLGEAVPCRDHPVRTTGLTGVLGMKRRIVVAAAATQPGSHCLTVAYPFLLSAVLCLLAMLWQGQDASWDLLNYHLYTPLAWLEGRLFAVPGGAMLDGVPVPLDVAAAQLQTWHNPLLDLPLAVWVREGGSGVLVSAWLCLPVVVAVGFALRTMDLLWPAGRSWGRTLFAALAGMSGAAVLPAVGTSFNDAFVAAFVLAALWWVVDSHGKRGPWATWLPVGVLAGAAAGLKLTSAIHCVGFLAAALCAGPGRWRLMRVLALGVGGVSGFVSTWGYWGWQVWQQYGNPLFPYFNQWFASPDAAALPHTDERFQLANAWDWVLVPFQLWVPSTRFSEMAVADPRILLGLAALGLGLVLAWRGQRAGVASGASAQAQEDRVPAWDRLLPVAVFVVAAFAAWACVYGIYRYLFALELLCAMLFAATLHAWVAPRWRWACLPLALVALDAATDPPRWGRQPFHTPMVEVQWPALPADAMVVTSGIVPMAHAVAFLQQPVPVLSVYNNFMAPTRCTGLQRQVEARIRAHAGSLWLLRPVEDVSAAWTRVQAYDLDVEGLCLPVQDSLMALELCPLRRTAFRPGLPGPSGISAGAGVCLGGD